MLTAKVAAEEAQPLRLDERLHQAAKARSYSSCQSLMEQAACQQTPAKETQPQDLWRLYLGQ